MLISIVNSLECICLWLHTCVLVLVIYKNEISVKKRQTQKLLHMYVEISFGTYIIYASVFRHLQTYIHIRTYMLINTHSCNYIYQTYYGVYLLYLYVRVCIDALLLTYIYITNLYAHTPFYIVILQEQAERIGQPVRTELTTKIVIVRARHAC